MKTPPLCDYNFVSLFVSRESIRIFRPPVQRVKYNWLFLCSRIEFFGSDSRKIRAAFAHLELYRGAYAPESTGTSIRTVLICKSLITHVGLPVIEGVAALTKYITKRIFYALITLTVVITLTFFMMYLIPGGPFLSEKAPSAATTAALKAKYGLDQPVYIQFKNYVEKAIQGDFGPSLKQRGRFVSDIIASKFPVSARVGGIAVLAALITGIPLGAYSALHRGKWADKIISLISTAGIAMPSFVVSTLLVFLLSITLKLLPTFGLTGLENYIMPVIALSLYPMAYIARLMRSGLLDVLGQDYMRTARAKGLSPAKQLFKHAIRNAILPVVTYLGPTIAYILTGSFIVETIFVIPGIGREFITSILARDYPMVMGTTIFLATLIIILNVIVDIAYKFIDPRIKLQ